MFLTLGWIFFLMSTIASAETVRLKSGKIIEGDIIEQTQQYFKIDDGKNVIKVPRKMIVKDRPRGLPTSHNSTDIIATMEPKLNNDMTISLFRNLTQNGKRIGIQQVRVVTYGFLPGFEVLKTVGRIPDDIAKTYYDNGSLSGTLNYKNNALNGVSQEFYPGGQLITETKYINNVPRYMKVFDEKGNLRIKLLISEDATDFETKYYDENGEVLTEEELKNGEIWLPDFEKIKKEGKRN